MLLQENKSKNIVVITSSFPRFKGDYSGIFISKICEKLSSDFNLIILAPKDSLSSSEEEWSNLKIYRHRQRLLPGNGIAYGNGIMNNLKKKPWLLFALPFFFLFQIIALKRLCKQCNVDLIHAHWLIPQGFCVVFYRLFFNKQIKLLATIHGSDINGFNNSAGTWMKKFILKRIDALTVVSKPIQQKAIELGCATEIVITPDAVDTNLFSPDKSDEALKSKYQIRGPFLLFTGSLHEGKGVRYLIQAMPLIIKKISDVKLLIVGDGDLKNELTKLVEELNISVNVIFTGVIPHHDLPPYFATADIFILPSFAEGWPVVVMEALSSGLTTVVTDIPVFKNLEQSERLFTIVPKGDADAIATAVINLLSDKESMNRIRTEGRQYAVSNLDLKVISNQYKILLESMTQQ